MSRYTLLQDQSVPISIIVAFGAYFRDCGNAVDAKANVVLTERELLAEAEEMLVQVEDGGGLDKSDLALIDIGLKAAVTCLDRIGLEAAIRHALSLGIAPQAIGEIIALVSGLGVHSLMISSAFLVSETETAGEQLGTELDAERLRLWARYVGDDAYWNGFESSCPGFLGALLKLSPLLFQRFFEYCAVPWDHGIVAASTKELTAMAVDASPTHRFRPGFLLHLNNARKLGVGRSAILEALALASAAPLHNGVR